MLALPLVLVVSFLETFFVSGMSLAETKKGIKDGNIYMKATNLGGWLVAEHWMTTGKVQLIHKISTIEPPRRGVVFRIMLPIKESTPPCNTLERKEVTS